MDPPPADAPRLPTHGRPSYPPRVLPGYSFERVGRPARLSLVILIGFGVLMLGSLVWHQRRMDATIVEHEHVVALADRVQQRLALSHLWFEELLGGDESIDLERDVLAHIDAATTIVSDARGGASRSVLLVEPGIASMLERLEDDLRVFRARVLVRASDRDVGRIGGVADQEFDALFDRLLSRCQALQSALDAALGAHRSELRWLNRAVLAALTLVFCVVAWMLVTSQRALARHGEQLEARVAERTTEVRRSMALAEQASMAKTEFLANMSHELRTPMNAVIGLTALLRDTPLSATQREYVSTIRTSGEALLDIINDILDYSKIEARRIDLEHAPFHLRECLEDALEQVSPSAAAKGLELTCAVPPEADGLLVGDVSRLRQVVLNLLSNAVKFTARGEVSLSAALAPLPDGTCQVSITVRDTGIGIPQDRRDALFQAFSQVDASTTRQYGGTGLGLAISRQLCERMGGSMTLESEVGQGSVFTAIVRVSPGPADLATQAAASRRALRILLVEDNKVNQMVAQAMLGKLGYHADQASNGYDALEALERRRYDVVLMDVQMPEMDGIEATQRIVARWPQDQRPRIIAMTADAFDDSRMRCQAAGMDDYVTKPVELEKLEGALARSIVARVASGAPPVPDDAPPAAPRA